MGGSSDSGSEKKISIAAGKSVSPDVTTVNPFEDEEAFFKNAHRSQSMEGSPDAGKSIAEDDPTWDSLEQWKAFFEFLRNCKPPCSLSECTADQAVEFLRQLPSDEIEAIVDSLNASTAKEIFGNYKENPFGSAIVKTFLKERVKEAGGERDYGEKKFNFQSLPGGYKSEITGGQDDVDKEDLFKKCLTITGGQDDDSPGNYYHESSGSAVLNPTSATSAKTHEYREKLKEVQIPPQLRMTEHSITWFDPILVISCGDNQDSEEAYFISCILNELCLRGFTPFSYDLTRSMVTGNPDMIYSSRVCIMIFSMNCARSRESLDEFVAIMDHLKGNNVAVLPVFFKVSLFDVRGQGGSFERVFSRLGNSVQDLKWETVMMELTSINRYQYMKGHEVSQAKSIVRDVWFLLDSKTSRNLVGIKLLLERILPLLRCPQPLAPQIVGLWGMAGVGKTAITREIFRKQAERYDASYFLPDFHLMCQTKGLSYLRDEFFSRIFGEEKVFIDACDTKISFIRDRFLDKRLFVVLDGVTNAGDVEVLVGGLRLFSGGHTIILTSRNRQVLIQCKVKELYEIPKLSKVESFSLFRQYAAETYQKRRMTLMSELVNYANGIPLALRVLGSSVQEKYLKNEKEHLRKLRQHPPVEIQDAFRKSFDGLHDNEKNIFLDLACFFRGEDKDHVVNMLDGCGFSTDLGIYALIDESLISLVDNKIEMPNIFQDTGRFVVYQEDNEAGKRSRLWDTDDIADLMTNNSGTEAIEGIFLDASGLTLELSPSVFERMYRLRLLKLYCATSDNHCKLCLPEGLHSLPDELRLLHWERYPLGSLPRNFNPKNLVDLNMPYSNLTKLWKGTKNLEKLKRIILSHSRQLTKFPRLSKAMNLEYIDLEGCTSLVKVNSSILHHRKLTFLSLKDCSQLRIMPTTVHLESLEVLNLSGCSELEDLQDFSPNLKELYLAGTAIREMPSSIGDLTRLVTLDLENCERLQHLPPAISNLKSLVTLKLVGCSNLKSLPILGALFLRDPKLLNKKITMEESTPSRLHSGIQEPRLDGTETHLNLKHLQLRSDIQGSCISKDAVEEILPAFENRESMDRIPQESWPRVTVTVLPSSILHSLASRLYALVSLFLCNAYLVDIPEELSWLASMKALDLSGNCFSQIPKSIKELRKLESLRLRHCKNLISLPELPRSLVILNAHGCVSLESFPSSFDQFPRHYTFSNCFSLSPKMVKKYIGKALDSVESMAKGRLQEHNSAPAFSICIPASAGHKSSINFKAGSSVRIELTPGMLKTLSSFALSVVVEFWDNYDNAAGFGIKCICRKTRTSLSPRLERIFQFWAPKESPTIQKDHMLLFGYTIMHTGERNDLGFWADLVTFQFHPVNAENQLLDDSCTVKRCGVHLITEATCGTALGAKRPSSSMDPGEHMAPPYKRCRWKSVIETVILSLRKRKREESISTVKNHSKVHLAPVSARLEQDKNYRNLEENESKELGSHKSSTVETSPSQFSSFLTDSPTSICKPTESEARIRLVARARSLENKRIKEFRVSVSRARSLENKQVKEFRMPFYSDDSVDAAAIRIQNNFRSYKSRKQYLSTRQGIILVQAHWRGYQVRKNIRNNSSENKPADMLDRADSALQMAMSQLEDEFRRILIRNTVPQDAEQLYGLMRHVFLYVTDGDVVEDVENFGLVADGDGNGSGSRRLFYERERSIGRDHRVNLINPTAVEDLKEIAERMIRAGYEKECVQVYSTVRRDALDECLMILGVEKLMMLGVEKLSIEQMQKVEWSYMDDKMKKWIQAMKITVRVLLTGEKKLCDEIFNGSESSKVCFNETTKSCVMQLLNFGKAVAIGRVSSERLFRILDMYDALANVLQDLEVMVTDYFVCNEAKGVLEALGDAVRGTLVEFENNVRNETSKKPTTNGEIHPMIRYVMNYMKLIMDYAVTLNLLLENDELDGDDCTTEEISPLAKRMMRLMTSLESKLEEKSKLYEDVGLQNVFLMNNIHYIVQKVKDSELGKLLGDDWVRKRTGQMRQYATGYLRASWSWVLSALREESMGGSSSGTPSYGQTSNSSEMVLKERFRGFNASFEELYRIQTAWKVPDPQLREELRICISEKLIPAYRAFSEKNKSQLEGGRDAVKYTPDDVESYLPDLFEGTPLVIHPRRKNS